MVDDLYLHKVAGRSIQPSLVDDTDNSISYSGDWDAIGPGELVGGTKDTPSMAQDKTVHQTRSPTAVATFRFEGTSVSVQGLVVTGCQPPMTFTVDGKGTATAAQSLSGCLDGALTSMQWFSVNLTSGEHVLTMQMRGTASQINEFFILDYIQYMPSENPPLSTTPTITRSTAGTSTSTSKLTPPTTSITTEQPSTQTVSSQAIQTLSITSNQSFSTTTGSEVSKGPSPALSTITTAKQLQTSDTVSFGSNAASSVSSSNTIVPSSSESAHQQQSPSANNTHSVPIGAIIGAVVGALVLVFVVMFFWRKRRSGTNRSISLPMNQTTKRVLVHDDTPNIPREVEPFPSTLQPRMAQEKSNFSSSQELTSDDFEANTADHSSATNTGLRELVTRLEREVAGMQVRYAQLEGNSTDQVVTSTDDEGQIQPILPPPYYDDTRSNK